MAIEITHRSDATGGRYSLVLDGAEVGELDHHDADGVRTFTHTGVRSQHEGQGLAAHLVRRGLADARADRVKIVPACSYVVTYLRRHPEDEDLLA
jgi:predicted GNAT family acetyltransferase